MSSGGLASQNNFAQTGTLDWVQLGNSVLGQTLKVLAQLANQGVDHYIIKLAVEIARCLPLGREGYDRIVAATKNLGVYTTINKGLLFGMGPKSIPHMLEVSLAGLAFLAISSALSEVYVEEVVAEVLHELLLQLKPTREMTPAMQSRSKIVRGCAGTLAQTDFGIRAEEFMRRHPSEKSLFPTRNLELHDHHNDKWRSRSHSRDIAIALLTLGEVSRRKIESVTIVGGGDIGFLAAIAEWLFNIKIVIIGHENEELYRTSAYGNTVGARFQFRDRNDPLESESMDLDVFQYSSKVVHLKDVSDILFMNDGNTSMQVGGRLQWSQCLSIAFGYAFQTLMKKQTVFGEVLGCAARIFRAVATAEPGIDFSTRKHWIYYTDQGSGQGYLQNLVTNFPELRGVMSIAQERAACK